MFEPLDDSLKNIARGAVIAMIGITSGLSFNFISYLIGHAVVT